MSAANLSRDEAVVAVQTLHAYLRQSRPAWTHARPAREGYYWLKQGFGDVLVVRVRVDYGEPDNPFVVQIGEAATTGVQYLRDFAGCQWYGPLEIPAVDP